MHANYRGLYRAGMKQLDELIKRAQEIPALKRLGPKRVEWSVSLELVGAVRSKSLNRSYRGKDYPTDVLSFGSPEPIRALGHLGELVICVPVLKRQAERFGLREKEELRILLVHGFLHLLGLDHEVSSAAAKKMGRFEQELLSRLGLLERSL